jgi:hypothetical protein
MYPGVTSKKAPVVLLAGILWLQMFPCLVHGQALPNFVQDDFQHKINLYDVNGHPIGNDAVETKGSPLLTVKWKRGWIRLADGRFFPGVPLRLDLEKQVVHYQRADGNDIVVEPGQVKELAILDTVAGAEVVYQFSCGYPPIDNQSETNFYLVLDSGRVSFLESMQKAIRLDKSDFSGDAQREYTLYSDFYILCKGKLTRIKKDAKFFLGLTNDKHDQMEDYLRTSKVSFRSVDDIRQFIHYYNGLP